MSAKYAPEMFHALTDLFLISELFVSGMCGGTLTLSQLRIYTGEWACGLVLLAFIHVNFKWFRFSLKEHFLKLKKQSLRDDLTRFSSHGHVSEQTLHGGCPSLCFGPALGQVGPDLPASGHPFPSFSRWVPVQH